MAYHAVLIPEAIMATNVDSLNRSVQCTSADIDNGYVFTLSGKVGTSGSGVEVFTVAQSTSASPTGLWMAYSGDEIVVTDSRYKGLDPDPRNFFNATGKVFSAYKPQVGDIILLTAEAITTPYSASATYANIVTTSWKLDWAAAQSAAGLSYKLLGVKYISLATGAIDTQRVTAYELECVAN